MVARYNWRLSKSIKHWDCICNIFPVRYSDVDMTQQIYDKKHDPLSTYRRPFNINAVEEEKHYRFTPFEKETLPVQMKCLIATVISYVFHCVGKRPTYSI